MIARPALLKNVLTVVLGGLVLFAIAAIVLLAARDASDPRSPQVDRLAEPTPSAPRSNATSTLEESLGIKRLPVRWTPVGQLIDFSNARELEDASAALRGVYIAGLSGESRQVYATKREILSLGWEQDGVVLGFQTKRTAPSKLPDGELTFVWHGSTTISPQGDAVDTLDAIPKWTLNPPPESDFGARSSASGLAGGSQVLVVYRTSSPPSPPLTSRVYHIQAVYIVDERGEGRKLEGIADLSGVTWFPNGKAILGQRGAVQLAQGEAYFIPTGDGEVVLVPKPIGVAVEGTQAGVSGSGSRAAFIVINPSPGARDAYAGVYDSETGTVRLLGPGGSSYVVMWPSGSSQFLIGGEIVDATTGERQKGSLDDIRPPSTPPWEALSPDGRYVASVQIDPPAGWRATPECEGLPFNLRLRDVSGGQTKTLLQCQGGHPGGVTWLNERQLVASIGTCWACGGGSSNLLLIDVVTGEAKSLTDGLETRARFRASPDGSKVLVDGDTLRVFDTEGRLIKDFGRPPEGFKFEGLAWSPDSSSVVFVVGPEGWPWWP